MTLRYIAIGFMAVILWGCGTSRTTQSSQSTPAEEVTEAPEPRILYPKSNNHSTQRVQPKGVAHKPVQTATQKDDKQTSRPPVKPTPTDVQEITFTQVESANIRVPGINPLPSDGLSLSLSQLSGDFCYPYKGKLISNYGYRGRSMHTGVDLKAIPNDTIRAAMSGVVRMSKSYSGYGNLIVIRHYCGIETAYSHNSKNLVSPNDVVRAGDPIALAGRTGRATTEHLHFEVRVAGEHVDPNKLLDCQNMTLQHGTLNLAWRGGRVQATNGAMPAEELVAETQPTQSIPASHITPAAPRPTNDSTPSKSHAAQYHRVVKGDTLSKIARDNNTTVTALCQLNNIAKTTILQLGQRIRVK